MVPLPCNTFKPQTKHPAKKIPAECLGFYPALERVFNREKTISSRNSLEKRKLSKLRQKSQSISLSSSEQNQPKAALTLGS